MRLGGSVCLGAVASLVSAVPHVTHLRIGRLVRCLRNDLSMCARRRRPGARCWLVLRFLGFSSCATRGAVTLVTVTRPDLPLPRASPGPHEGADWHPATGVVVMEPCGFARLRGVNSIHRPESCYGQDKRRKDETTG